MPSWQPGLPDKLQEFRNMFFAADSLSQKLPSPHFLQPLSSLLPVPVFVLSWSDTPFLGLHLPFPPLLVTFHSPLLWWVVPAHCHSGTLSFS